MLYWELSQRGFKPREADELELWEIAVLLQGPKAWGMEAPGAAEQQDPRAHLHARLNAVKKESKFEWGAPSEAERTDTLALINALQ